MDRPTLYIACKLHGCSKEHVADIRNICEELREYFQVLPFNYDLLRGQPIGTREGVLPNDFGHVEMADMMLVIFNHDVSDGRGMEIAHRLGQNLIKRQRLLLVTTGGFEELSPMVYGIPLKYPEVHLFGNVPLRHVPWHFYEWARKRRALYSSTGEGITRPNNLTEISRLPV